ncbi:MAG: DMT family transporter [Microbacterium sp.]|uniref:DMT family transporter n=1 Tax=Microbacterium sp. TaxID=51671 RepID=UPI002718DA8B|nr:DMT family transporter [Microbacterium sp.]MDO8384287.1 DMT family transporter [Microbacterium sp.]
MRQRPPVLLSALGAVSVGAMTAVQARMNGGLGSESGDGIFAAFVSFGSGLLILVALAPVTPAGRAAMGRLFAGVRERRIPAWMLLGGLAGALTTVTQGLTVGLLGVSLFTVGVVAGQTVGGLVLDRAGYGPAGVVPVTMRRIGGGALALVAVAVGLVGSTVVSVPWSMLTLPFLAGAGIAWQQATNGRLRQRVESAFAATFVNFLGGTVILGVAAAIHIAFVGPPAVLPTNPWLYLGGATGVVYIFVSAGLVRYTGVLLLGLGSVVGLLATSVVLDVAWPTGANLDVPRALIAVAIALIAVLVVVLPRRRPTP